MLPPGYIPGFVSVGSVVRVCVYTVPAFLLCRRLVSGTVFCRCSAVTLGALTSEDFACLWGVGGVFPWVQRFSGIVCCNPSLPTPRRGNTFTTWWCRFKVPREVKSVFLPKTKRSRGGRAAKSGLIFRPVRLVASQKSCTTESFTWLSYCGRTLDLTES